MKMTHKITGFTLIELIMVIVLIGVVATAGSAMISQGLNSLLTIRKLTDATWQGQFALERMIRDIRAVRSANDITTSTANEFAFTDMDGNSIDYKISGTSLMQGSQIVADGINSLSFTYYDKNGTSGASIANVHYVKISLNVTQNNTNYTIDTIAYLRDLSS